jgi:hypothetical protein
LINGFNLMCISLMRFMVCALRICKEMKRGENVSKVLRCHNLAPLQEKHI